MIDQEVDPYEPLYEDYKRELRELYEKLIAERSVVIKRLVDEDGMSAENAMQKFNMEEGPLVHDGRAICLIRKYWLEIARLEKERTLKGLETMLPLTFLVEDLMDDEEDDLVEFLTEIAYWPIGLNQNNDWC
jgi:hypothetical protein